MTRVEILTKLRDKISQRRPIVGAGAGTGISGKCAEAGGADLIVIYNSGRFRMAGQDLGPDAVSDANTIVVEMSREVLPVVRKRLCWPVCGTDPFRLMDVFLRIGASDSQAWNFRRSV